MVFQVQPSIVENMRTILCHIGNDQKAKDQRFSKIGVGSSVQGHCFLIMKNAALAVPAIPINLWNISRNEFKQKCYWHHVTHKLRHCAQVVNVDKSHLLNWAEGGYFLWEVISSLRNCFRWVLSSQNSNIEAKNIYFSFCGTTARWQLIRLLLIQVPIQLFTLTE